jgi:hypothetical protein
MWSLRRKKGPLSDAQWAESIAKASARNRCQITRIVSPKKKRRYRRKTTNESKLVRAEEAIILAMAAK